MSEPDRRPMKTYLAGPMRGYAEHNYPAFREAAKQLRALGYEVFNPAEHAPMPLEGTEPEQADIRLWMRQDLAWICEEAEAIVVLPGWERSLGAKAEVATADAIVIPVWELAEVLDA